MELILKRATWEPVVAKDRPIPGLDSVHDISNLVHIYGLICYHEIMQITNKPCCVGITEMGFSLVSRQRKIHLLRRINILSKAVSSKESICTIWRKSEMYPGVCIG